MAAYESQIRKILCPVCHRADKVQRIQGAFDSGVQRLAPPPMPVRQVSMMKFIFPLVVVLGIAVFFIIVLLGNASTSWFQVVITLAIIVATLATSFYAFQRVLRGDQESEKLLPAWDESMARWQSLFYCRRDDVVFDATKEKVLSNEELASIRSYGTSAPQSISGAATPVAHS
ncbi:MAG TPA: hypothetical protein VFN23_13055 [Ktedonobacteraceae bacterium]|nr:hypothetical protein [Ktedonobacteraceae bacterium]